MTTWGEFRVLEPGLAETVEELFATRRHKTIATLRADGSPRISGIECEFSDELTFGSMLDSRKLADLHRDSRFALHSPSIDPVEGDEASWPGEAKIAGRVVSMGNISGDDVPSGEQFRAEITEVSVVRLDPLGLKLVIEWWTPVAGRQRTERN